MKTALITGAAKGIGRAVALGLAQDGFRIALHYHTSSEAAEQTVAAIREAGGKAEPFAADLTVPAEAEELVRRVIGTCGGVHTLVSNAGILQSQLLALTGLDTWREVHAANLDAAFLLTKAHIKFLLL